MGFVLVEKKGSSFLMCCVTSVMSDSIDGSLPGSSVHGIV